MKLNLRSLLVTSICISLVGMGCQSTADEEESVPGLVRSGQYQEAVLLAAERVAESPDDPVVLENHRLASVALFLERGRRLTFKERDEEALVEFELALALAPEDPFVEQWILKTRDKLARRWLDTALEYAATDHVGAALEAYANALYYDPSDPDARAGLERCETLLEYRSGQGDGYYLDGVRAMRSYDLHLASTLFDYTNKYRPYDRRALERGGVVDGLLAQSALAQARNMREEGLYSGARHAYHQVLLLEPTNVEAEEGKAAMEREVEAQGLLGHAEWLVLRDRYDEALEALDEGLAMTEYQADEFESRRIDIQEIFFRQMYGRAYDLEQDFQYEEAVLAYDELLEASGYYEDAIQRRRTLEGFIAKAAELYEISQSTSDEAEALSALRQIRVFWPEYRDIQRRIARLERQP